MKLNVTKSEALALIRKALMLPSDTIVTISRDINPNAKPSARDHVKRLIEDIDKLRYNGDQKIEAIKRFRETINCSLFEANASIEDWPKLREWILKNRRRPVFTSVGRSFSWE